jgi:hypothetical protein
MGEGEGAGEEDKGIKRIVWRSGGDGRDEGKERKELKRRRAVDDECE